MDLKVMHHGAPDQVTEVQSVTSQDELKNIKIKSLYILRFA